MNKRPEIILFNCPVCGVDNRLGKKLSGELKERGLMREQISYYIAHQEGVVKDPAREAMLPIGGSLPAFRIYLDVCLGTPDKPCGCYYVAKLEIFDITKRVTPAKLGGLPPGSPFSIS